MQQAGTGRSSYRGELEHVPWHEWSWWIGEALEDSVPARAALNEEGHPHLGEHIGAVTGLIVYAQAGPHSVIQRALERRESLTKSILRVGPGAHIHRGAGITNELPVEIRCAAHVIERVLLVQQTHPRE